MLTDVDVDVSGDTWDDVKVVVSDNKVIVLKFALAASYDVDVVAGVWAEAAVNIDVWIAVRANVLFDELTGVLIAVITRVASGFENVLVSVMTALEFTILA